MRKTARLLLKHRWLSASLTTLVALISVAVLPLPYLFFSDKISLIISTIFSLFATTPTLIGYKRWCANLEFDKKPSLFETFYFFTTPKRYLRGVFTGIILFLRTTLVVIFAMVPTASLLILADWLKTQPQNDVTDIFIKNCTLLAVAGAVIFLVLLVISTVKISSTSYFVAVDDTVSVFRAMKLSSGFFWENGGCIFKNLLLVAPLAVLILPIFIIIPYLVVIVTQSTKQYLKQKSPS